MFRNLLTGLLVVVVAPAAFLLYAHYKAQQPRVEVKPAPQPWQPSFDRWDRNGDQRLSRREVPSGPMHRHMDTDRNGQVTPTEAEAYFYRRRAGSVDPIDPVREQRLAEAAERYRARLAAQARAGEDTDKPPTVGPRRARGPRNRRRRPRGI